VYKTKDSYKSPVLIKFSTICYIILLDTNYEILESQNVMQYFFSYEVIFVTMHNYL